MIYLTHYRTASTTNVELFDDIIYPQKVNWFLRLTTESSLAWSMSPTSWPRRCLTLSC